MECIILDCVRDAETSYCAKHQLAADNIEENYEKWKVAYGKVLTRQKYLERLAQDLDIGAGIWVTEVADHLLNQD